MVRLLDAITIASGRLASLECRTVAEADRRRLGDEIGARHTHQWWAARSRQTHAAAARLTRLGTALASDLHAPVASALADGTVRLEQARVIVEAVDALPSRVDAETRGLAEATLLELAAEHDARDLKQIGKRILDVVAPEVGESHEEAVLEAEEARAAAGVELTLVRRRRGPLPRPVHCAVPRRRDAEASPAGTGQPGPPHRGRAPRDESGEWKPLRRRLGEAFVDYVERYPLDATPQTAGVNATVVVTMTLEQLLAGHATALLDDGTRMSAGQARRLACEARIIPVVLGTDSQPLDLGRAARLFTKAQRIALGLRDGGCTARGCETSASGCHAHHDDPWSRGGRTDLANGRLLCPRHHRLAHSSRYAVTIHADNSVTYVLRT